MPLTQSLQNPLFRYLCNSYITNPNLRLNGVNIHFPSVTMEEAVRKQDCHFPSKFFTDNSGTRILHGEVVVAWFFFSSENRTFLTKLYRLTHMHTHRNNNKKGTFMKAIHQMSRIIINFLSQWTDKNFQ